MVQSFFKKAVAVLMACAVLSAVSAEQFVLIDKVFSFTGGGRQCPDWQGPKNWVSPVNYYQGNLYFRYEVTAKPTDLLMHIQLCNWTSGENCIRSKVCSFKTKGVFYCVSTPSSRDTWWYKDNKMVDWTTRKTMCIVLKDPGGGKWVSTKVASYCMGPSAAEHLPVKFRLTAIPVSKGAKLIPPADWTGCHADWGCDGQVSAEKPVQAPARISQFTIDAMSDNAITVTSGMSDFLVIISDYKGRIISRSRIRSAGSHVIKASKGSGMYLVRCIGAGPVDTKHIFIP